MASPRRSKSSARGAAAPVRDRRWAPVAAILLGLLGTVVLQKALAVTVAAAWPPGDVMTAVSAAEEARQAGDPRR